MNAVTTLTFVHVAISLAGIASGFVVLWGFLTRQRRDRWTPFFLATTSATSASGFLFPVDHVTPGHVLGVISLVVLAIAFFARYRRQLAGRWAAVFVISTVLAQYLNFFVLIVQLFMKVPVLKSLAPTQSEPTFVIAQLMTLVAFVVIGVVGTLRFRSEKIALAAGSVSKQYPAADYIQAKKMLAGLAYQVVRPEAAIAESGSLPTSRIAAAE